jgi:hypothetical protein
MRPLSLIKNVTNNTLNQQLESYCFGVISFFTLTCLFADKFFNKNFTAFGSSYGTQFLPNNFSASDTSIVKSVIQWKVDDSKTSISSYNLFIDGKWKVIEYDKKNKLLIHVFEPSEKGLINFKLQVKDACGNEALWTKKIRVN